MSINFTREEILNALKRIDENPKLKTNRHSSTYDLIFNKKAYPPILVLSVANEIKNGNELTLQDFSNNVDIPFKTLRDLDFEIAAKHKKNRIDNKEEFRNWVLENLTEKSGAGPSYITSIDWLSARFYEAGIIQNKSIFQIEDVELLNNLHSEVKTMQRDTESIIFNKNAPSYGNNYFYSASLSKYIEFLQSKRMSNQNMPSDDIIYSNKSIREFAKYVFTLFYGENLVEVINNSSSSKPSSINDTSYIFHDYKIFKRLIGEFNSPQTKDDLTSSKTIRFFEEPIYVKGNKHFYFSTQWYGVGEHSLTFQNLKIFFERKFPNYRLSVKDGVFSLYKTKSIGATPVKSVSSPFEIDAFIEKLEASGLIYSKQLIARFCASLITKPFLILTGLSGSGKTKLAQAFVQWICQEKSQFRIIPVGADWTNREPLLGYPNALKPEDYVKPDNGVLDLIIQANSNPEFPHFLILDEMNLSHVERYFADFLSVMESKEDIPLYAEGTVENGVPHSLRLPSNLFIIGTVNIDETTNMFSPKVLDRANTIEFRVDVSEMKHFLGHIKDLDMALLDTEGVNMANSFLEIAANQTFKNDDAKTINETLLIFFAELKKTGAEFGYRSATEILRLINQLSVLDARLSINERIDIAIMQKLLPKLHGSRRKLCPVLVTLGQFCVEGALNVEEKVFKNDDFNYKDDKVLYSLSLEKIARMHKGAIDNGFASFAEA